MAVAAILNLEEWLPFRYYLTSHRQIYLEYCYFD